MSRRKLSIEQADQLRAEYRADRDRLCLIEGERALFYDTALRLSDIAARYGIAPSTAWSIIHNLSYTTDRQRNPRRVRSESDVLAMRRALDSGMRVRDVAALCGVSTNTVYRHIKASPLLTQ